MKKKIFILAFAIIMLSVASSVSTLSYFTDSESVVNGFTIGDVDTTLFRYYNDITSTTYTKSMADNLNAGYEEWLGYSVNTLEAGKNISMKPYVLNHGNVDAYVRIRVYFPYELYDKGYVAFSYGDASRLPGEDPGDSEFVRSFANFMIDGKRYLEVTFTRREPLKAGYKTISPVYQYVGLKKEILKDDTVDLSGFADENGKLNIRVTSDAVQAYGFSTPQQAFSYIDN